MAQLIGVLVAALFVVLTIDVPRIAVLTAAVAVVIGALAVVAYHRRKLAELRELHAQHEGTVAPVHRAQRWPKRCLTCHHRLHSWREVSDHADPAKSPCAALIVAAETRAAADERAAAGAPPWTATVIGKGGDAAVDTMLDEPEQIES